MANLRIMNIFIALTSQTGCEVYTFLKRINGTNEVVMKNPTNSPFSEESRIHSLPCKFLNLPLLLS